MTFLVMIFTALTAIFTGLSVYLIWKRKQPIIEIFGEQVRENEFKCNLTLRNISDAVAKIYEIRAHKPLYSTVCPMAGIRSKPENDIIDTSRYDSSFKKQLVITPKSEGGMIFFFSSGDAAVKNIAVNIRTSWSHLPFIERKYVIINIVIE